MVLSLVVGAYFTQVPGYQEQALPPSLVEIQKPFIPSKNFLGQVAVIRKIVEGVIAETQSGAEETIYIRNRQKRLAQDIINKKSSICYDRSWLIESLAERAGYPARRVFLLASSTTNSRPGFFSKNVISHAMSEIRTEKGWVLVENQEPWLGVLNGAAVSVSDIFHDRTILQQIPLAKKDHILYKNFTFYRGLYSRHGQLFEPYAPFPEIRWSDFFWSLD